MHRSVIVLKFKHIAICILLCALQLIKPQVLCASDNDTTSFRITFEVSSTTILVDKFDNASQLEAIKSLWEELSKEGVCCYINIGVRGNASLEGLEDFSYRLARSRGVETKYYLSTTLSIPDSLISIYPSRHMLVGARERIDTLSSSIRDMVNMEDVQSIIGSNQPQNLRRAFMECDSTGHTWEWFRENVLAPTRYCDVEFYYAKAKPVPVVAPVAVSEPVTEIQPEAEKEEEPQRSRNCFRIKTNILYDAITVANLGFEFGFAEHFGISILGTFSPWDIRPNFKIRTLLFQPEVRYYLKKGYERHYFGIDGHFGWYNVAMPNSATRYQDRNGNTPLWGAGLVYGYVLPITKHIGFDFSIGGGYAYLDYDCFFNIENGKKYTSAKRGYWGLTNLGASFYFRF